MRTTIKIAVEDAYRMGGSIEVTSDKSLQYNLERALHHIAQDEVIKILASTLLIHDKHNEGAKALMKAASDYLEEQGWLVP